MLIKLLRIVYFITVVLLTNLSFANSNWTWNFTVNNVQEAIVKADDENKKAQAVKYEWRDTEKLIKKAQKVVKTDPQKALDLAYKAFKQAKNAQEQAISQKNAGPRF